MTVCMSTRIDRRTALMRCASFVLASRKNPGKSSPAKKDEAQKIVRRIYVSFAEPEEFLVFWMLRWLFEAVFFGVFLGAFAFFVLLLPMGCIREITIRSASHQCSISRP